MNERGHDIATQPLEPARLAGLIRLVADGRITTPVAKTVFERMYSTGRTAEDIVAAEGLASVHDEDALGRAVAQVLTQQAETVAQYRGGRTQVFGFLVGQVMKASGGKANPKAVNDLLRRALDAPDA
jgi:aspartyl-tRNA(Asn)/glutamyl-tRNA(Gln) amidotransferase subunit B